MRVAARLRGYGRPRELVVRYVVLTLVLALMVGPLLWQLLSSLKGDGEAIFGDAAGLIPREPTLEAYQTVFDQAPMARYMLNSLIMCALTVTSQVIFPTLAGYMMSRQGWRGRKAVYAVLIVSMIFPFESIMVSLFMMVRDAGLVDNLIGVWLPGAIAAVNVLIMRATFDAVPDEVEDAALLDGANEWQRFTKIYLPASVGAMMVVIINSFIAAWDDFLWPFIVLRSENLFTLTLGLSRMAESSLGYDVRIVMAGSVISIAPILILFIVLQRWFYKGVAEGAVK
ncbi:carbohydrate ABC transporter permease [Jiangella aurantiaca]|uniref:Carbohydrate ABC transporter permease n=1 Tax=Jiangella aurantiaca TaxID=2530373 RepID=A0A4R5AIU8_9ACTN|nr:carbohydrate ABC transporter permease [Jiangella aurantiaca]TDD71645.1 carbohydrate ABC transporter permease [Jiangella aurantiaca]